LTPGVGWRLLASTEVDVVGIGAEDDVKDGLGQPAEHVDPEVDIKAPELILNCRWIFDEEDEDVSRNDDSVKEEHRLSCQDEFQKVVETTN